MKRLMPLVFIACVQYREVGVDFGKNADGLAGFLCRDTDGGMMLDRLGGDGGLQTASLVTEIVGIENGQPGCRTGQLLEWCDEHECKPLAQTRICQTVQLPTGLKGVKREDALKLVRDQIRTLRDKAIVDNAPDEFVILRMVATAQPCSELAANGNTLPDFDPARLVGCAYSCPTLFDRAESAIYLGFETLTAQCEQGVRICASGKLDWMP
jgi:hypothetical protein